MQSGTQWPRNGETLLGMKRTSRVGKYEIVDEIGHGGMATVYRARDTRLNRLVALKVMHPHLQGAKEARARFAREALTIARLKHPNILEIYDYSGEDGDTHYIATELLRGPTLKQLVEGHPDLPAEIAACLAILIARALNAAHAEGVIHRDVKPENVMIHENHAVKLTDFGIAQLVDVQGMTSTGEVLGSPGHMAPEQIEGRDCDARTDIFSLGTVLYLLATSELPFQGRNTHQVLKQIAEGRYSDPLLLKPQIGARLREIIVRCLAVDPARRYASTAELEGELLQFVRVLEIEDPGAVIAEYLEDPGAAQRFVARIIEAETSLGERALQSGEWLRAMDAFNRVLSLDGHNERVLSLIKSLGRRRTLRRVTAWGLWACAGLIGVGLIGRGVWSYTAALDPLSISDSAEASDVVRAADPARGPNAPGSELRTSSSEGGARALSAAAGKSQPADADAEPSRRRVVLRPEPANVSISIDGAPARAFGPSFRTVELTPGPHVFAFKGAHDCCVDVQTTVDVPAGAGNFIVSQRLLFRPAAVYVVSNTPADVHVDDGSVVGRTWSLIQVPQANQPSAVHTLRVSAEGYREVTREVRLRAGQIQRIEVTLPSVLITAPTLPTAPTASSSPTAPNVQGSPTPQGASGLPGLTTPPPSNAPAP